MSNLWREPFRVRFFDAEPGGRASIPAVCRFMQEAAGSQTERLGLNIRQVRDTGRMWVLTRFALNVFALPSIGDEILVETWASDRTAGLRAYRDFRIGDASGKVLAEARSLWLMLDLSTRRPVRLPESVLRIRHSERIGEAAVDAAALAAVDSYGYEDTFKVRWSDLDENGHANNIRYIEWLLGTVPMEVCRDTSLVSLDVQFVNEVLPGECVTSLADASGAAFHHKLTGAGNRVLGLARTVWQPGTPPTIEA